jgi:exonuclease SbcC
MSYGEVMQALDFTGMSLACLSGDNGNGKSAILDAMTWALWGEARGSSDELIRLGTDEMRVTFDFRLGEDLYRVIRGRSKRSSGNLWEIYVGNDAGDFRPITGQGIRDTGRIIQRILRMDYKTFINSAYIQQGRADEFTKQSVGDRKKILAEILDLSRYDALEQKAKDRRSLAELSVNDLDREIGLIETELAHVGEYESQLSETRTLRESLEKRVLEIEEQFRGLQARKAELDAAASRVEELRRQIEAWRSEIAGLSSRKSIQEQRVARSREVLADKEKTLAGLEELTYTRESIAEFDLRLERLRALEREKSELENVIQSEKHKLETNRQLMAREVLEIEKRIAEGTRVEQEIGALREEASALDDLSSKRAERDNEIAELSNALGAMKGERDLLVGLKEELQGKLAVIAQPGGSCPLCGAELGPQRHAEVVADYKAQIAEKEARIAELMRSGSEVKAKRDAAQAQIKEIVDNLEAGKKVRDRLAQAEQMVVMLEDLRSRLPDSRKKLSILELQLSSNDYAVDQFIRFKSVGVEIESLQYDSEKHKVMKEALLRLSQFEGKAAELRHAEENLPTDEANLKSITDLIESREKSITEAEKLTAELGTSLEDLAVVKSDMSRIGAELSELRENDRQFTGRIATLEQSLERCKNLGISAGEKRKTLEQAKIDRSMYNELVAAFGKKGVQSLIIENAIPEIQDEANALLARMTDNAMQVSIETVKDKKTGGFAETLDIKISDDMGTRSYELFSGGEAFRVNFALRIALSKLLAKRAGASLQTLIVDEGFGTQDGKGRERLVEAIDSIKGDFEKILVITHIDELKDAFPTRIEITKDAQGSHILVE